MQNYTCLGSHAAIIFLESNICWVSSGTVSALLVKIQSTAALKLLSELTEVYISPKNEYFCITPKNGSAQECGPKGGPHGNISA